MLKNVITHQHHKIPKHLGGTDDASNLIELTIEDHAIAHKVLYGLYQKLEDYLAWKGLLGLIDRVEISKLLLIESNKNRIWTEDMRQHLSNVRKGRILTEKHKQRISNSLKKSIEHRSNNAKTLFWCNNGIEELFVRNLPDGFMKGRLTKSLRGFKK